VTDVPVDLVVNCYQRTCADVLAAGVVASIAADQLVRFESRTVLVNNVDDRAGVERTATALIDAGEIDRLAFVADHLGAALAATGLTRADLEPLAHFNDWGLVAATLPGPEWVLHWDAEARLVEPFDWVTPAIELMERDDRILCATPYWNVPTLDRATVERVGPFALGYGFSDQVWLARRADLSRPIYRDRTVARLRYPMVHVGEIFESRIDSHMRRHRRLRAVHTGATYAHPPNMGVGHPPRTIPQTLRYARNRLVTRVLMAAPVKPRTARYM
jgi:hypothetical protein